MIKFSEYGNKLFQTETFDYPSALVEHDIEDENWYLYFEPDKGSRRSQTRGFHEVSYIWNIKKHTFFEGKQFYSEPLVFKLNTHTINVNYHGLGNNKTIIMSARLALFTWRANPRLHASRSTERHNVHVPLRPWLFNYSKLKMFGLRCWFLLAVHN